MGYSRPRPALVLLFLIALLSGGCLPAAAAASEAGGPWRLLAGYGTSHPNMGKTRTRVETVDLVGRYERLLLESVGSSWYQGNHSLLFELPVHLIVDPKVAPMLGANFLACWTFTAGTRLQPYLFAGGGPLYMMTDIQGMGTRLNGNYQFGGGLRFRTGGRQLLAEYRFHHVSNGGRREPNEPLNSSKLLVGMAF